MARLAELPPELVIHVVSFLTREMILEGAVKADIVPDLPSVNALSRTNSVFHNTLNHNLYQLCASVESLGRLAILFAAEHNSGDAFDKLVAAGVSVDGEFQSRLSLAVPCPYSLLQIAAGKGSSLIVLKLLRMYGSETLARVYARDRSGWSALDFAVCEGNMEIVELLAPMAILTASSSSPITVDLSDERIQAHKEYLGKALVKCGARDSSGEKFAICEYLLSEGADVNTRDTYLHSALSLATLHDSLATMQLLLAAGADPNLGNGYGVVPLFRAENIPAAQALLDAGACIHATENAGRNVLMYRALQNTELLRFLLERGVDPNQADNKGWTPLHYACEEQKTGAAEIELLLQFGATTAADIVGVTPAEYAMQKGKIEVVRLLEPLIQDPALKARIAEWLEGRRKPEDISHAVCGTSRRSRR